MPSKLDPHLPLIESWLADEPQLTALAIVGRLAERDPQHFGPKQHSIVQRLLKKLRIKAAQVITQPALPTLETAERKGLVSPAGLSRPDPSTVPSGSDSTDACVLRSRFV